MNRSTKLRLHLIAAAACMIGSALVAAPARADAQTPAAAPASAAAKKTQWVKLPRKHNGSGVQLNYSVPAGLQAGQTIAVQLQFSGITQDDASVEIKAPAGVGLVAASGSLPARMALPRGRATALTLQVTPAADGLQYLRVFSSQGGRSTVQLIPLKVGTGQVQLKSNGAAQTTPTGEKVISLPSSKN